MADRNRSITLSDDDRMRLKAQLRTAAEVEAGRRESFENRIFRGDSLDLCRSLPDKSADLIFADPPYAGLRKQYGSRLFNIDDPAEYRQWLAPFLTEFRRILTDSGSLYLCGDWRGGAIIQELLNEGFIIQNRICWEREKGRGARSNWKNSHEDIWFATVRDDYFFDVEAVKILREVRAPYRSGGVPKDWVEEGGIARRLTYPGNFWNDLTVPFWSMRENTEHPTQKPEKLLARIILASLRPGGLVFDPFLGSGTTAAVAKKLGRPFCGGELEEEYALLALRRLEMAEQDGGIQGTLRGPADSLIFLERNVSRSFADKVKDLLDRQR